MFLVFMFIPYLFNRKIIPFHLHHQRKTADTAKRSLWRLSPCLHGEFSTSHNAWIWLLLLLLPFHAHAPFCLASTQSNLLLFSSSSSLFSTVDPLTGAKLFTGASFVLVCLLLCVCVLYTVVFGLRNNLYMQLGTYYLNKKVLFYSHLIYITIQLIVHLK